MEIIIKMTKEEQQQAAIDKAIKMVGIDSSLYDIEAEYMVLGEVRFILKTDKEES